MQDAQEEAPNAGHPPSPLENTNGADEVSCSTPNYDNAKTGDETEPTCSSKATTDTNNEINPTRDHDTNPTQDNQTNALPLPTNPDALPPPPVSTKELPKQPPPRRISSPTTSTIEVICAKRDRRSASFSSISKVVLTKDLSDRSFDVGNAQEDTPLAEENASSNDVSSNEFSKPSNELNESSNDHAAGEPAIVVSSVGIRYEMHAPTDKGRVPFFQNLRQRCTDTACGTDDAPLVLDDVRFFHILAHHDNNNYYTSYPEIGTEDWDRLYQEANDFGAELLLSKMTEILAVEVDAKMGHLRSAITELEGKGDGRQLEGLKVELQRLQFERSKAELESRNRMSRLSFAYNLLIVGVTGTGKSSSLNTILDETVCHVSGAQAQGTRGTVMRDGAISSDQFVSFIDTQGLGADTSVTDEELLAQIMMATESVFKMRIINNILISFDLNTRTTPSTMANQLTLMELFTGLRSSCFLCLTKWNTNAVQSEWNFPLRLWIRKHRRCRNIEEITQDPPSYEEMYGAYCDYILKSMANEEDGGAFSKMGTFLAFFEARVLWMFNLDGIQIEDREDGELEPHIEKLYTFYRRKALRTLVAGASRIDTKDLSFLRSDQDTMKSVARSLIETRDTKIQQLESCGLEIEKREQLKTVFSNMSEVVKTNIAESNFQGNNFIDQLADIAGFVKSVTVAGCVVS